MAETVGENVGEKVGESLGEIDKLNQGLSNQGHDQVSSGKFLEFFICDAIYRCFETPWSLEKKTKFQV